jgi:hypothetical protein
VPATPPEAANPYAAPSASSSSATSAYAPPRAHVADAMPAEIPRPDAATRAVRCLWASFVVSIIAVLVALARPEPVQNVGPAFEARATIMAVMIVFFILMFALGAWINIKIARGRNWARILYLLMCLMWLPTIPALAFGAIAGTVSALDIFFNLVNFALSMAVCYFLLKGESREWFAAVKEAG